MDKSTPDSAAIDATLAAAAAEYRAGDFQTMAERLARLLLQTPDHPDALRLRGLALSRAGRPAEGLPLLARARELRPGDGLAVLHHGIGLQIGGRYARAAALFRRAAMMLPNDPAPWVNLSAALLALGQIKAARAAARRATVLAPDHGGGHYSLGLAEQAALDLESARDAFAEAARLQPTFPEAWLNLGVVLFQLGEASEAWRSMRRALDLRPGWGLADANLAALELVRGETDQALGRLRGALANDPDCVPARLNLANALLLERLPEEAVALLDAPPPPGRDGAHWRAHRSMGLLMLGQRETARMELDAIPMPYGDAEILILWRRIHLAVGDGDEQTAGGLAERMSVLADQGAGALMEHRIIGLFDLARFHVQRGRITAAFDHWRRAHRLMAISQPFSREREAAFFDASVACYDHGRLRNGPRAENDDPTPVFVVGMPRSGTTLVEQILAAHPQVHGAGERSALTRLLSRLSGGLDTPATVRTAAALDRAKLTSASHEFSAELRALAPEARRIVDKMPGNARHLGFLATLLPGARVIHCRRDPRDIGLSIWQLRFFGYHPYAHDLADLGWYIHQHERLMAHWREVLPIPMIEVALSDWVNDFDATLRRVLAFVDLPYDEACTRFFELSRRVRTASAEQVRHPINARGLGRWRAFEQELEPMIAQLSVAGVVD